MHQNTQADLLGFAEIEIEGTDPATEKTEDLTWLHAEGAWEEFQTNRCTVVAEVEAEEVEDDEVNITEEITEWLRILNMLLALNWDAGDLKTTTKYKEMGAYCLALNLVPYYDGECNTFTVLPISSMYTNVRTENNELGSTYLVKGDSERFGVDAILYESYHQVYCLNWIADEMGGKSR